MPLRGLSRSMEVLLKMTKRMNRKMMTSLPPLRIDLISMICKGGYHPSMIGSMIEGVMPSNTS